MQVLVVQIFVSISQMISTMAPYISNLTLASQLLCDILPCVHYAS